MATPASDEEPPGWPWLGAYEPHPDWADARPVLGATGMVSTPHPLASAAGLDVLRAGGNAVDAAVAASAALMVAVPMQCSPGGDAVWLIRNAEGRIACLDATGAAPASASAEALRARGLARIGARSVEAVTVPGAVDGWVEAVRRHGSRPLADLLEPAAQLAERGVIVSRHLHASFKAALPALEEWGALAIWSADGAPPALYGTLTNPALAATLRAIGGSAGRDFYEGALCRRIVAAVAGAGGAMSPSDLANHRSEWVEPLSTRFRGLTLVTSPPATQGIALLEAARLIETLAPAALDLSAPLSVHLAVEAVAAALADRDGFVCDRRILRHPPADLISPRRIEALAARVDPRRAGHWDAARGVGKGRGDTAHLAVVDGKGNAVSLIQSVFFDFGTGIPVDGGGFTLQNRGAAFSLASGSVNELAGGMRPPHTLAPSIACRDGALAHVMGCMGGDGQVQTQVQLLLAMVDGGFDPQQAIARPRWYLERGEGGSPRLLVEAGIGQEIVEGLRARGREVVVLGPSEEIMGHAQVIAIAPTGARIGAADRRSDGQAAGW